MLTSRDAITLKSYEGTLKVLKFFRTVRAFIVLVSGGSAVPAYLAPIELQKTLLIATNMAYFIRPVLRRCLRLHAHCSSGTAIPAPKAVKARMWESSYGRNREPPGVPILAYLREMTAGGSAQRESSFLSQKTENCRWKGSAFRHERQQFQARCHHLCGQKRQYCRKIKPLSSWKRRFQITSDGKYLRKQKGKRHKSFSKSRKRRLHLRASKLVHKSCVSPIKKMGFALQ